MSSSTTVRVCLPQIAFELILRNAVVLKFAAYSEVRSFQAGRKLDVIASDFDLEKVAEFDFKPFPVHGSLKERTIEVTLPCLRFLINVS
jgi:hypothetical protein